MIAVSELAISLWSYTKIGQIEQAKNSAFSQCQVEFDPQNCNHLSLLLFLGQTGEYEHIFHILGIP